MPLSWIYLGAVNALSRQCILTGLSEHSLLAYVISTKLLSSGVLYWSYNVKTNGYNKSTKFVLLLYFFINIFLDIHTCFNFMSNWNNLKALKNCSIQVGSLRPFHLI